MDSNNNLRALDMVTLLSYILQIQNAEADKKYKGSVQEFEKMVQKEVDKLHKENDLIMEKLDDILRRFDD